MHLVEVTLVNLSEDVSNDANGELFPRIAAIELHSCTTAQQMLKRKRSGYFSSKGEDDSSEQVQRKLVKYVTRYVLVKDKYTALSSLFLKSQAFYQTFSSMIQKGLSVVELPRTEKGKPFIPTTAFALEKEANCFPISVSHQFPFCGLARLVLKDDTTNMTDKNLGMDIVVFDPLRADLYDSVQDFLEAFQSSFTGWEWQQMHSSYLSDQELMKEFYLRWSMKEAYTKALGHGMSLDFSAFETRLDLVDKNDGKSIWCVVSEAKAGSGIHLRGRIVTEIEEAHWDFYFLPLFNDSQAAGCACICFGPLENASCAPFGERIIWSTLHDAIQWHEDR